MSTILSNSKRQAVIRAASDLFDKKTDKRTTYAELSAASGVPEAEIKAEFRNKMVLALEVQAYELDELKKQYLANMPNASPRETVKFILRSRINFNGKHTDRSFRFFIWALSGKEPWSSRLDRLIWQFSIEFASFIEKGIREGRYGGGIDVTTIVRMLTSIYLTGIVTIGFRAKEYDAEAVWRFIEPQLDYVFDSIHL